MKQNLHPVYVESKVVCACGNEFVTRATRPEIRLEVCSVCHPFFTGKQKMMDTEGRVQRFKNRYKNFEGKK